MTQRMKRTLGVCRIVVTCVALGFLTEAVLAQPSKQTNVRDDNQHELGQAATDSPDSQWNQFRGPNGTGVAVGARPPVKFDLKKNLHWATALPAGHSSPVIWKNRIFITGMKDGQFETLCIDRTTGNILWRKTAPKVEIEKHHPDNSPATSTPYVDARRVYVYFGSFGLLCYDHDGKEVWRHPVSTPLNMHGTATSPVGYKHLLYLIHDSMDGDSYVLSVEKSTGREVWKATRPIRNPNWSTPVIWQKKSGAELIVLGGGLLKAYEPLTGKELWSVDGFGHPIPLPVVSKNYLYTSTLSGNEAGKSDSFLRWKAYAKYDANSDGRIHVSEIPETEVTTLYEDLPDGRFPTRAMVSWFDRDQDNAFTEQELQHFLERQNLNVRSRIVAIRPEANEKSGKDRVVWKYERSIPHKTCCLAAQGRIYMIKDGGVVTCLDAESGKLQYQSRVGRGYYSSSPIYANGKIYICSREGIVSVLQVGNRLKPLAENDLGEPIVATPAIADDTLYVRTKQHLYAFTKMDSE